MNSNAPSAQSPTRKGEGSRNHNRAGNDGRITAALFALAAFFISVLMFAGTPMTSVTTGATLCVNPGGTGGCFSTIQAAINAAMPGDTINVAAGTYNEMVQVNKTVILRGAQAGVDARTRPAVSESIVTHGDGPIQIIADNVVLDGFTITGASNDPSMPPFTALGAGIWTNPGFSGTQGGHQILNNIIRDNISGLYLHNTGAIQTQIRFNLFQNNNLAGPISGDAVFSELGLSNALIDNNKFTGHSDAAAFILGPPGANITLSNNESSANGRAFAFGDLTTVSITGNVCTGATFAASADIRIFGGVSALTVRENLLSGGAGDAIRIDDIFGMDPNSNITMGCNSIDGYAGDGLELVTGGYTGTLDATGNWWGSATGPTIASNPGGTGETIIDPAVQVIYSPFLTSGTDGDPGASGFQCCTGITCPANITQANDPNQCGAVVTYPAPTPGGPCGTITCTPASGSFFPKGTTTVTCSVPSGFMCSFTVTVNDTQPPTIICPANVIVVIPPGGAVVTYPPPTVTDNCPGATAACVPASGSTFPVGTTTVTCTATDAMGNTATCTFTVGAFDVCLQDDSNPTTVLIFNSLTGDYRFCCSGNVFTGKGTVKKIGNVISLSHLALDRRVQAQFDGALKRGSADLQSPPGTPRCTITDRNTTNNTCACM